ncbi:hypothetical protein [Sphingobacterium sp. JUb56]|uniref:hypothetical protein n=1 Tax=Sphingobacterium sp. JUb56 TaxID=2587145 RepID=UPI00160E9865|nr:hypothetical protein [Sphingobacterium sp. JUb56]MBB2950106.1 hypothetical protein [Sphingobacterium sp. JUb56]
MKEHKIHSNEGGNLLSIKSFENTYSDRNCLINAILNLSEKMGYFYINASRPDYTDSELLSKLNLVLNDKKNFIYNNFEISFEGTNLNEEVINLLPLIWFHYQHVAFSFFRSSGKKFITKGMSWKDITQKETSYVMFKGAEEDVVWIGKSKELKFDLNQ